MFDLSNEKFLLPISQTQGPLIEILKISHGQIAVVFGFAVMHLQTAYKAAYGTEINEDMIYAMVLSELGDEIVDIAPESVDEMNLTLAILSNIQDVIFQSVVDNSKDRMISRDEAENAARTRLRFDSDLSSKKTELLKAYEERRSEGDGPGDELDGGMK